MFDNIIGMTFKEAKTFVEEQVYSIRIVMKDDEEYIVPMNYDKFRVNVSIVNDKVVYFKLG